MSVVIAVVCWDFTQQEQTFMAMFQQETIITLPSALYVLTALLVSVRLLRMMSFEVQTTVVATQKHSFHLVCIISALVRPGIMYPKWDYVSITIVQSYNGKYHHFIAVGFIVTSVQCE